MFRVAGRSRGVLSERNTLSLISKLRSNVCSGGSPFLLKLCNLLPQVRPYDYQLVSGVLQLTEHLLPRGALLQLYLLYTSVVNFGFCRSRDCLPDGIMHKLTFLAC